MAVNTFGQDITQVGGSIVPTATQMPPTYTPPSSITSSQLTPQPQIQLSPPPTPSAPSIVGGNAIIAANNATLNPPTPTAPQADFSSMLRDVIGPPPPSASDQYNTDYNNSNITTLQSDYNTQKQNLITAQGKLAGINAQLAGITAENTAIPIRDQQNAEGRGITAAGLAPLTAGELRMNALKAIPLQAQALAAQAEVAAAQGNATLSQSILQQAQDHLDKVFQIHQQDTTNQYNYQKDIRDKVYQFATAQEQRQLDAQQKAADQAHQDQLDALKNAQAIAKTAMDNGQADIAAKITTLDPKSPSYQQDLANLQAQVSPVKDLQYVSGTANQAAGYFDKKTGKFTPLGGGSPGTPGSIPPSPDIANDVSKLDPQSKSILAQTGLSFFAFKLATDGVQALSRMTSSQRTAIGNELKAWADKNNVDLSTFSSQYKAQNEVLQNNIARANNTTIAAQEIMGTVDQFLQDVAPQDFSKGPFGGGNRPFASNGLSSLRPAVILDIMAGKQVNNPTAQKYAFDIATMANDLAGYYAASRTVTVGGTVPVPTETDKAEAASVISSGLNAGSAQAFKDSIATNEQKVTGVVMKAVDNAQQQVWNLFGVGKNFRPQNQQSTTGGSFDTTAARAKYGY